MLVAMTTKKEKKPLEISLSKAYLLISRKWSQSVFCIYVMTRGHAAPSSNLNIVVILGRFKNNLAHILFDDPWPKILQNKWVH